MIFNFFENKWYLKDIFHISRSCNPDTLKRYKKLICKMVQLKHAFICLNNESFIHKRFWKLDKISR